MMPAIQSFAAAAANALAASVLQGLLLAAAVALCLRLVPRIPAAARSLIWTAVFALILALPFLSSSETASPAHSLAINPLWTLALAALWLTLSLIRAVQLVLSALTLHRLASTATPLFGTGNSLYTLCSSPLVDRPSVIGFFSRRILLPPELYSSLTPAELHHVLLHETEHLRRRDDWTNLLQKLALVLIPLHPVLLWVERRLCLERELACDDRVLRATGSPKAYATCLTHLAEQSLLRRSVTLALGFFERQSELTRRVHRILLSPQQIMSSRQTFAATAILLVALAGGSLELAHAPQLIHFAVPAAQSAELEPLATTTRVPTYRPATFHIADAAARRPELAKAVLTSRVPPSWPTSHTSTTVHPVQRVRHAIAQRHTRDNPVHALQARWDDAAAPGSTRFLVTTASANRVCFTFVPAVAVATPTGWIIVQL